MLAVFVLTGAAVTTAAAQPGQPPAPPGGPPPVRPLPPRPVPDARVADLEEELELVEAARDVRRAHVKAADVAVEATKTRFDLVTKNMGAATSGAEQAAV
jgi:hypothetical protein